MPVSRNRSVTQDLIDLVYEKVHEISDPRSQMGRSGDITLVDFVMYTLAVFHQKTHLCLALMTNDDRPQFKAMPRACITLSTYLAILI